MITEAQIKKRVSGLYSPMVRRLGAEVLAARQTSRPTRCKTSRTHLVRSSRTRSENPCWN